MSDGLELALNDFWASLRLPILPGAFTSSARYGPPEIQMSKSARPLFGFGASLAELPVPPLRTGLTLTRRYLSLSFADRRSRYWVMDERTIPSGVLDARATDHLNRATLCGLEI